jgi:hypothetical protein
MASVNLKNMDVDALLKLRSDVEKALADRGRDLRRQNCAARRRGRKEARQASGEAGANKRHEGRESRAEVPRPQWRDMGGPGRDAAVAGGPCRGRTFPRKSF